MTTPQTQATVTPQARPSINETFWHVFEARCRLNGWTEEQIAKRRELYFNRKP